jgi:hypothetical protein
MELIINELDDSIFNDNIENYYEDTSQESFEQIPENIIKVIKKNVQFDDSLKPLHQSFPKANSKRIRTQVANQGPKISFDDILSKMGTFVSDGKLHLVDRNALPQQQQPKQLQQQYQQQQQLQQAETNIPQNSYIYNKYFKDNMQQHDTIRKPKTLQEYKIMVIKDYIQAQRIKQMKSTKLIMPTSNINMSSGHSSNLNKLFNFSKR